MQDESVLTDKTKVRGVRWQDLKHEAMAPNFVISGKFNSYTFEEQNRIKELIEAQLAQGDMLGLNALPTHSDEDANSMPLSTRPPASSYDPSMSNAAYQENAFVPVVKKIDAEKLIADIDGMIQAHSRKKELTSA
jgi:hypothetical protein